MAEINKINIKGVDYDIGGGTPVHTINATFSMVDSPILSSSVWGLAASLSLLYIQLPEMLPSDISNVRILTSFQGIDLEFTPKLGIFKATASINGEINTMFLVPYVENNIQYALAFEERKADNRNKALLFFTIQNLISESVAFTSIDLQCIDFLVKHNLLYGLTITHDFIVFKPAVFTVDINTSVVKYEKYIGINATSDTAGSVEMYVLFINIDTNTLSIRKINNFADET